MAAAFIFQISEPNCVALIIGMCLSQGENFVLNIVMVVLMDKLIPCVGWLQSKEVRVCCCVTSTNKNKTLKFYNLGARTLNAKNAP